MNLPSTRQISIFGSPIAYRVAGDGPPLLLIHGWGGSSRYWLGAYLTMAPRRTIYALDLPGYGDSPPLPVTTDLAVLARVTLAAIDALELDTFALAGHSLGAAVAVLVAAQRPQQIERVALASFGLARNPGEAWLAAGAGAQLGLNTALWAPWLALWRPWLELSRPWRQLLAMTPPIPAIMASQLLHTMPDHPALAIGAADFISMDTLTAMACAASVGDPAVGAQAARVRAPALVLTGRQDPIAPPESAAALAAAIPSSALLVLEACGHVPMAEQPTAFYQVLTEFMA